MNSWIIITYELVTINYQLLIINYQLLIIFKEGNPYHQPTYRFPPTGKGSRKGSQKGSPKGFPRSGGFPTLFIVSVSRSPLGLDSKGSTFGAHFRLAPKRVDFWGSFSHLGGSFVSFLAHFSSLGSTLGALGAHFLITKAVWATKGATRGKTPDINSLFESHFEVIVWIFFDLLGLCF